MRPDFPEGSGVMELKSVHAFRSAPALSDTMMFPDSLPCVGDHLGGYMESLADSSEAHVGESGLDREVVLPVAASLSPSPEPSDDPEVPLLPTSPQESADQPLFSLRPDTTGVVKESFNTVPLEIPVAAYTLHGPWLWVARFRAMICKRFHYALRDRKAIISQVYYGVLRK